MSDQRVCITEVIHPDGSSEAYLPNGSVYSRNPPGTFIIVRPLDLNEFDPEGESN